MPVAPAGIGPVTETVPVTAAGTEPSRENRADPSASTNQTAMSRSVVSGIPPNGREVDVHA